MNVIRLRKNGPMICEGKFVLEADGKHYDSNAEPLFLCRCGRSKKKPFCDGSHKQIEFDDMTQINDDKPEPLEDENGQVEITLRDNAMLIIKGPVTITREDATSSTTRLKAALCRCGHSKKKPFCDISHKRCDFVT